jgi:hypothetical protein
MSSNDDCDSALRWTGALVDESSGRVAFERLSLYNCSTGRTWSAWSDGENLIQGFLQDSRAGGQNEIPLESSNVGVDNDYLHNFNFRLLGPALSFFLCSLSFIYLYRRRNIKRLGHHDVALAEHPNVPLSAKIAVPIILYLTVGLFSFSNAAIGAKVTAGVEVFDRKIFTTSLFDFSLVNTVTDMWNAGVYPLSALVCIWSGFWPYLKCLLMLAAWFCPPTVLAESHRRRLLISMDILGKWALLGKPT